MLENTKQAIKRINIAIAQLVYEEITDVNFGDILKDLAFRDYTPIHDKIIEGLIVAFGTGCYRTVKVPSIQRTAINSPNHKEIQDIEFYVKQLVDSDIDQVQLGFWRIYENLWMGKPDPKRYDRKNAISEQIIRDEIKRIESDKNK